MELLIFYPIAIGCILLALGVIFSNNPVNSAICLIGMMLGLGGLFAVTQAHFIAVLQIIVYAGAIMVLFMFVIMLLNLKSDAKGWNSRPRNTFLSVLTGLLMLGALYKVIDVILETDFGAPQKLSETFGTVEQIGASLFTDFVLPFEVASVLLLAAMVGAVVLAKTKLD